MIREMLGPVVAVASAFGFICDLGHPPWCADCQARLEDQLAVAIAIAKGEHPRYVVGTYDGGWCIVDALEDNTEPAVLFGDAGFDEVLLAMFVLAQEADRRRLSEQVEPVDTSPARVEEPPQNEHNGGEDGTP